MAVRVDIMASTVSRGANAALAYYNSSDHSCSVRRSQVHLDMDLAGLDCRYMFDRSSSQHQRGFKLVRPKLASTTQAPF